MAPALVSASIRAWAPAASHITASQPWVSSEDPQPRVIPGLRVVDDAPSTDSAGGTYLRSNIVSSSAATALPPKVCIRRKSPGPAAVFDNRRFVHPGGSSSKTRPAQRLRAQSPRQCEPSPLTGQGADAAPAAASVLCEGSTRVVATREPLPASFLSPPQQLRGLSDVRGIVPSIAVGGASPAPLADAAHRTILARERITGAPKTVYSRVVDEPSAARPRLPSGRISPERGVEQPPRKYYQSTVVSQIRRPTYDFLQEEYTTYLTSGENGVGDSIPTTVAAEAAMTDVAISEAEAPDGRRLPLAASRISVPLAASRVSTTQSAAQAPTVLPVNPQLRLLVQSQQPPQEPDGARSFGGRSTLGTSLQKDGSAQNRPVKPEKGAVAAASSAVPRQPKPGVSAGVSRSSVEDDIAPGFSASVRRSAGAPFSARAASKEITIKAGTTAAEKALAAAPTSTFFPAARPVPRNLRAASLPISKRDPKDVGVEASPSTTGEPMNDQQRIRQFGLPAAGAGHAVLGQALKGVPEVLATGAGTTPANGCYKQAKGSIHGRPFYVDAKDTRLQKQPRSSMTNACFKGGSSSSSGAAPPVALGGERGTPATACSGARRALPTTRILSYVADVSATREPPDRLSSSQSSMPTTREGHGSQSLTSESMGNTYSTVKRLISSPGGKQQFVMATPFDGTSRIRAFSPEAALKSSSVPEVPAPPLRYASSSRNGYTTVAATYSSPAVAREVSATPIAMEPPLTFFSVPLQSATSGDVAPRLRAPTAPQPTAGSSSSSTCPVPSGRVTSEDAVSTSVARPTSSQPVGPPTIFSPPSATSDGAAAHLRLLSVPMEPEARQSGPSVFAAAVPVQAVPAEILTARCTQQTSPVAPPACARTTGPTCSSNAVPAQAPSLVLRTQVPKDADARLANPQEANSEDSSPEDTSPDVAAKASVTVPASTAATRTLLAGEPIAYDQWGLPSIVRQVDGETGNARTVVRSLLDGSQYAFGKSTIDSLSTSSRKDAEVWVSQFSDQQMHGLVHEVGQRLLEHSQRYQAQIKDLERSNEALSYMYFGLSEDASDKELDKVYRQLAKKMHPDRNGGTEEAKQRFQNMKERYESLKRKLSEKKDDKNSGEETDKNLDEALTAEQHGGFGGHLEDGEAPREEGEASAPKRKEAYDEDDDLPQENDEPKESFITFDPENRDSMEKTMWQMLEQMQGFEAHSDKVMQELRKVKSQLPMQAAAKPATPPPPEIVEEAETAENEAPAAAPHNDDLLRGLASNLLGAEMERSTPVTAENADFD